MKKREALAQGRPSQSGGPISAAKKAPTPDRPSPRPAKCNNFVTSLKRRAGAGWPRLLRLLRQGPMDVASLIEATGFSQSHISRQLGQLHRAGLVRCERDGVRLTCHAESAWVDDLCHLVQNRLRQRLESQPQTLAGG